MEFFFKLKIENNFLKNLGPKSKTFFKFQNIFGNGILAFLNSKTFTRILDREISRFVGFTDRRCRSLDSIAKLDDREENFWRGYRSRSRRNSTIAKIFGEVVDRAQQICVADHEKIEIFNREQKNLFVPRCNELEDVDGSVREGRTTVICR